MNMALMIDQEMKTTKKNLKRIVSIFCLTGRHLPFRNIFLKKPSGFSFSIGIAFSTNI